MRKVCKGQEGDSAILLFDFPPGATVFSIKNGITGITINSETGVVTINFTTFEGLGSFLVLFEFTLDGVVTIYPEEILVVDCSVKPIVTNYNICIDGDYTTQLLFTNGATFSDITLIDGDGVTVSPTGLMTITTDGIDSPTVITIGYGGGLEAEITITVIACLTPDEIDLVECEKDGLCIVWVNQEGGRQSYYFNQPKEFGISQSDGKTYKNISKENRYFTRGNVGYGVAITQQFVPNEFVQSINSLKNAIQAWACADIDDVSTYKAIIIDEDSWVYNRTTDRYNTLSFNFDYAVNKTIQKQ